MFGGRVDLDRHLFARGGGGEKGAPAVVSVEDYIQNLDDDADRLVAVADAFQQKVIDHYVVDSPPNPTSFEVGDFVLLDYPKRPPHKLAARWQGPYTVVEKIGSTEYRIQNVANDKNYRVPVARLKIYKIDPSRAAAELAAHDDGELLVDDAIDHMGSSRDDLKFRIRWAGYGEEDDTWEPLENVRGCVPVEDYMVRHGIRP